MVADYRRVSADAETATGVSEGVCKGITKEQGSFFSCSFVSKHLTNETKCVIMWL